jgi:YD repeat-containing protein
LKEKYDGNPGTLLVTYYYNNRGQLTEKQYPGNTSVKFTYEPNGWLETAGNYAGTT